MEQLVTILIRILIGLGFLGLLFLLLGLGIIPIHVFTPAFNWIWFVLAAGCFGTVCFIFGGLRP